MPVYALLRAVNRELVKFTSSLLFSQFCCNSCRKTVLNGHLTFATLSMEGRERNKQRVKNVKRQLKHFQRG